MLARTAIGTRQIGKVCNGGPLTAAAIGGLGSRGKHSLPDLPYDYNALEPVISAEIMQIHHQKHHATYVNNLNQFEEKIQEALATAGVTSSNVEEKVHEMDTHGYLSKLRGPAFTGALQEQQSDLKTAVALGAQLKFNAGGHINHSIFWTNLAKDGGEPSGPLLDQINRDFGSLQRLQELVGAAAIGVHGSGWAWLGFCPKSKCLRVTTCPNQDPLEPTTGLIPLFGIDVWEHAYYLQYKSMRADYVKAIWKIANWKNVAERFTHAKQSGG